ncbi:putative CoA-binding protein [Desulfosporosinus acidiphilus SJ4]|uniref:Putative CoA-binding protein n=1 Tax=Desulfosporosinus acidiphilus (strain DSM 22704 / JCM 16185 / SJ4) TaxID=646529 RepID=I4D088_DESAJ|nr:CoA-binding protein [Desulfosporosinus acidiphilus]AFM39212.1 putative CoA-binding protein [Desulfosporosinus acidiphilus SJ4]
MNGNINDFLNQKSWAVIGVSENTSKFGYKVYVQLKKAGYTVFPINPKLNSIDGDPCFPALSALPLKPDAVSIIVPPQITEQIVQECISLGIKRVWMQPGSESTKAIEDGESNGIAVIHHECVLVETRNMIK